MSTTSNTSNAGLSDVSVANQWIEYLKRRNRNSTILWVLFLLLATAGISAAIYFYTQTYQMALEMVEFEIETRDLKAENANLKSLQDEQLATLNEQLRRLESENAQLQDNLNELDQLSGQTGDQLAINSQIVETLKAQVTALEEENSLLEDALSASKQEFAGIKNSQKSHDAIVRQQKLDLENRSRAYTALAKRLKETETELDSKASQLDQFKAQLNNSRENKNQLVQQVSRLNSENESLEQQIETIEQQNRDLSDKLKSLTQPVAAANRGSARILAPTSQSSAAQNEPKAADVQKNQARPTGNSQLNFDSIAID